MGTIERSSSLEIQPGPAKLPGRRLIVNADDLGLTPGVNRAIVELHQAGVLTSATLMASGPAYEDAVALVRAHPTLGVGCHVVLTDGVPVSSPAAIPSLLGPDRTSFPASLNTFLLRVLRGQVKPDEIRTEALAQIRRLQDAGIHVTHIDTHKHTHILPAVARPLLEAAEEAGLRAVRNPFEQAWSLRLGHPPRLRMLSVAVTSLLRRRTLGVPQLAKGRMHTTDGSIGISATGRLNEATLRMILDALPEGTWELVTHPGYNDRQLDGVTTRLRESRDIERQALLACLRPHAELSSQPVRPDLIHYGDL